MKRSLCFLVIIFVMYQTLGAQPGFTLEHRDDQKKVEVRYKGRLLTAYCYFDSTEKPILFPVKTPSGVTVTRGFPISPRPGERTDHPHHAGLWFNYESVNGLDFWNNSSAIPTEKKHLYGSIRHQSILSSSATANQARLETLSHWVDQNGNVLIEEVTEFVFKVEGKDFFIDRRSVLKAVADEVLFKDVKDGALGIRVARSLEMPSKQQDKFVDNNGNETAVPAMNNEGVTGMYVNKEGVKGDDVWSTKSIWTQLHGNVQTKPVSITIIDHPSNPGYPTYWHARGYGLFAANPLGRSVFSNGNEEMNFLLRKNESAAFRYLIILHDGEALNAKQIDAHTKKFHALK